MILPNMCSDFDGLYLDFAAIGVLFETVCTISTHSRSLISNQPSQAVVVTTPRIRAFSPYTTMIVGFTS